MKNSKKLNSVKNFVETWKNHGYEKGETHYFWSFGKFDSYDFQRTSFTTILFVRAFGKNIKKISATAQNILDCRKNYPNSSLADLYDPILMPKDLRDAHKKMI